MIRLKDVSRIYPAKAEASGGVIRALDDFTLSVDPGEWVAIMGPSGSGKSTLVNLIGCLDRPTSGEIWLHGVNVANMSSNELNRVRAEKVGFIFQQFHLIPYLTALENVMLAQYFHSMTDEQEALEALGRVGLVLAVHRLPGDDVDGAARRVAAAQGTLRAAVHLDALDVVEHGADAAGTRQVHSIEVERDTHVTVFRVVVVADASNIDLGIALLRADLQTGNCRCQTGDAGDADARELLFGEGRGRARIVL